MVFVEEEEVLRHANRNDYGEWLAGVNMAFVMTGMRTDTRNGHANNRFAHPILTIIIQLSHTE